MGMHLNLVRVSPAILKSYFDNYQLFEDYFMSSFKNGNEYHINLEKSWHGILYLLTEYTKNNPIIDKIFFNEQYIDESKNLGYGPANYLLPEQVNNI